MAFRMSFVPYEFLVMPLGLSYLQQDDGYDLLSTQSFLRDIS